MVLFENESYRLSIDESVPCLEWIGKKFMASQDFRTSEEKSLEFFKEYKVKYPRLQWFVDARDIGFISEEDTAWVAEVILPAFASSGLRKEAFVVPSSHFGKIAIDNYRSDAGETIEIEVFDNVQKAKDWLKK
ncbi:MAG: hypothetical protein JW984_07900 [Deltaproteobacteria bacterium]|uniref:STAS/SEC14 domain-containing protein n=1 Tax=Candidatus Zymogenus saltonus TaxID=2844893 RepID=A0A9D8KFC6_9DELT|nr:hypothetical protein [Candidatus Zymogenus saltonus]